MRLLDALRSATEEFEEAGIDDPLADAEVIVFAAAATDRLAAYMDNPDLDSRLRGRIARMVARRLKGEPVQYITGSIDFLRLKIFVGKGVLIPRPETELLVREAIAKVKALPVKGQVLRILDLCTGTGCIALALAKEFPLASVTGTDSSRTALRFAKKNAAENKVGNTRLLHGSLFEPVQGERFDLVISNPPYIRSQEIATLQKEVKDWEPREALDGGADGLDYYRAILSAAPTCLAGGGLIMFELGYDQAGDVRAIAEKNGFRMIEVMKDFAGIERILSARYSG